MIRILKWIAGLAIVTVSVMYFPQIKTWAQNTWAKIQASKIYSSIKNQFKKKEETDVVT